MAVDSGAHLLSQQQGGDLLLRGDELTSLGLLQGFTNEACVALNICTRKALTHPGKVQITHLLERFYQHENICTHLFRWKRRYLRMARLGRKVQLMQVRRCQCARLAGLLG